MTGEGEKVGQLVSWSVGQLESWLGERWKEEVLGVPGTS